MTTPRWFVTTVKHRHEAGVAAYLAAQGIEPFAPTCPVLREWSDRKKTVRFPLFPGYVFGHFALTHRDAVLRTPGVTSIVGFAGIAAAVPDEEVERVRAMMSAGLPLEPWPYLERGHRIRIERGPLKGLEGLIVEVKNDCRLVVSVTLLQRSVSVSIDRDLVAPVSA